MDKQDHTDEIDLRDVLKILKKRWYLIIGLALVAGMLSYWYSYNMITPSYQARAMLLVTMPATTQQPAARTTTDDLESVISTVTRLPQMTMNTYALQLTNEAVYSRVVEQLGLDEQGYSARSLRGLVRAEVVPDSNIIEVRVHHYNPQLAAAVANSVSEEYLAYLAERNNEHMLRTTETLIVQKNQTEAELAQAVERYRGTTGQIERQQIQNEITRLEKTLDLLAEKIAQTQIAMSIDFGGTNLVIASPAIVSINPVNRQRNIAVAIVLGVMLGVGIAFLLEFMDNTIKDSDDVQKYIGIPVVGAIPKYRKYRRRWFFRAKKT